MRIVELIQDVIEAEAAVRECRAACEVSPAYHCHRQDEAARKARAALEDALTDFIDDRVRAVLADLGGGL